LHDATAWATAGLLALLEPPELLELDVVVEGDAEPVVLAADDVVVLAGAGVVMVCVELLPQPAASRPVEAATDIRTNNDFRDMISPCGERTSSGAAATLGARRPAVSVGVVSDQSQSGIAGVAGEPETITLWPAVLIRIHACLQTRRNS
jgi:hypothetical protein